MITKPGLRELETYQEHEYRQREWPIQRISWMGKALSLFTMILGLWGIGVFSQAEAGAGGPLEVSYKRVGRSQVPLILRLRVEAEPESSQMVKLWLSRQYLNQFQAVSISPKPEEVEVIGDRLNYRFKRNLINKPLEITFFLTPKTFGLVSGQAGLPEQPPLSFSHFIHP